MLIIQMKPSANKKFALYARNRKMLVREVTREGGLNGCQGCTVLPGRWGLNFHTKKKKKKKEYSEWKDL